MPQVVLCVRHDGHARLQPGPGVGHEGAGTVAELAQGRDGAVADLGRLAVTGGDIGVDGVLWGEWEEWREVYFSCHTGVGRYPTCRLL